MNKKGPNSQGEKDEFTSSMAMLAELAKMDVEAKEGDERREREEQEEKERRLILPKRKKVKQAWYKRMTQESISVSMSYYAAAGILVLISGIGYVVVPEMIETLRLAQERVLPVKKISKPVYEEKGFTVVDVVDNLGGLENLEARSLDDLAAMIAEQNQETEIGFQGADMIPDEEGSELGDGLFMTMEGEEATDEPNVELTGEDGGPAYPWLAVCTTDPALKGGMTFDKVMEILLKLN